MMAGHFGLAAGVKASQISIPLWVLMVATQWLDIVFVPFVASGIETYERIPGTASYGGLLIHADYTHSLAGALLLSVIIGLPAAWAWGGRSGAVVGGVSFSHWLLDFVTHRGDLPLLPGNAGNFPKLGLGLWQLPITTAAIELILVAAGAFFYWRAADGVALSAGRGRRLAVANGVMALVFGIIVLALDVSGLAG
jgi:membrane-bound metal-dependent hydrolase YbcI (DUF457 family)